MFEFWVFDQRRRVAFTEDPELGMAIGRSFRAIGRPGLLVIPGGRR